ncbi:MAG: hypothetical protein H6563_12380 [Lewinellaceae bacterium]|nr:hypothetical protein [Lewinellaceae bacterium]
MKPFLIKIVKILGLIAVTIWVNYFGPKFLISPFYLGVLAACFFSKDEPFWLVFFLVISDGFLGFFNNYEAVLSAIPGLPPVEVGHFYIVLTFIKVLKKKPEEKPFYSSVLGALLVYMIFLVVEGYVVGVSPEMNVQFRIIKFILPLLLLYTIPRLINTEEQFRQVMILFIPFAFLALAAQIFTISTGLAPSQMMGLYQELWFTATLKTSKTYRGFYSTGMVLISFFSALYFIARDTKDFKKVLLYGVVAADFLSAFLSATRGWVLCFTFSTFFFLVFVLKLSARRLGVIALTVAVALLSLMSVPVVKKQFTSAFARILTLEALAGGDVTAGGTLERLDDRSPRVVHKWLESPLTGWGFSDEFFHYADFHVGNQNILMHSGIIGAALLFLFMVFFHLKLTQRSLALPHGHGYKNALLVFPIFFMGWFIIHSTSGQQFQYYDTPGGAIITGFYLSIGAFTFRKSFQENA